MLKTYQCHKRARAAKIVDITDCALTVHPSQQYTAMLHLADGSIVKAGDAYLKKHDPQVGGYYVEYEDDVRSSYSPAKAFEEGYRLLDAPALYCDSPEEEDAISALSFGAAIEALKAGKRVARAGWNGKGMWLLLNKGAIANPGPDLKTGESPLRVAPTVVDGISSDLFHWAHIGITTVLPSISMKTATGSILNGWLASQTDMLAEDWEILP